MIERVTLKNFKNHHDSEIALAPITILVGPNGAGKTSVLEALHLLGQIHFQAGSNLFSGARAYDSLVRHAPGVTSFELAASGDEESQPKGLTLRATSFETEVISSNGEPLQQREWSLGASTSQRGDYGVTHSPLFSYQQGAYWPRLRSCIFLRLDARNIATTSAANENARVQYDGSGVPTVIASLKLTDEARLERIINDLQRIVPRFKSLRALPSTAYTHDNQPVSGYRLVFDMDGGSNIPASGVSEGTLLALALLTVLHSSTRPKLLLLDDIHEALHPKAQKRLMDVLKELASGEDPVQIVATTHSPYILDCVEPTSVQVLGQRPDGSTAVRSLSEHPDASKFQGSLSSGQLWTLDDEQSWVP